MADINLSRKEVFYEERLKEWKENTGIFNSSNDGNDKKIIIAMSRKMPRLLNWIRRIKDFKLNSNYTLVTEHAIPFCLHENPDAEIKIIDDALYFGSTMDNVTQNIAWCTGKEKIEVYPILRANANKKLFYAKFEDSIKEINELDLPYFTTLTVKNILSLGKPMDVEYPILTFKRETRQETGNRDNWTGLLKDCFNGKQVYKIEHEIYDEKIHQYKKNVNYTVLLNDAGNNNRSRYDSDFSKLRIYATKDTIRIVSYAPLSINEADLVESSKLFEKTDFKELWNLVVSKASKVSDSILDFGHVILRDLRRQEYEISRLKSLVIWANYLSSYSMLLMYKESIIKFMHSIGFRSLPEINEEELCYLLGPQLVSEVKEELELLYIRSMGGPIKTQVYDYNLLPQNNIPFDCEEEYYERNHQSWSKCKFVSQALSAMFTNQHFCIGMSDSKSDIDRYRKLHFGVSYASIYSDLMSYFRYDEKLLPDIHHWIDRKIDEGCIAPKYERVALGDRYVWRRMFRAGENEDSYIKIIRIGYFIFNELASFFRTDKLYRKIVEELFSIIFNDPLHLINLDYKLGEFECEWNRNLLTWRTMLMDSISGIAFPLCEELFVNQGFLVSKIVDNVEYLYMPSTKLSSMLQGATSMSLEQEKWVKAYLKVYLSFYRSVYNTPINNFFIEKFTFETAPIYTLADLVKTYIMNYSGGGVSQTQAEIERELISCFRKYNILQLGVDLDSRIIDESPESSRLFSKLGRICNDSLKKQKKLFDLSATVLFYWELFKAIFVLNDVSHAQYTLNVLEYGLHKNMPNSVKQLCQRDDLGVNDTQLRRIVKSNLVSLYNVVLNDKNHS